MTSRINFLYGIHINHSTWGFLRFFVEHIKLIVSDKQAKVLKELSVSNPDEIILYLQDEIGSCKEFQNTIKNKVDDEFNFRERIRQLQKEYDVSRKNSLDSSATKDSLIKELGIKIGDTSRQYRSLIKETQDKEFDKSYNITLKFYDDVGGSTYHFDYTYNLDNFRDDIFHFFQRQYCKKILFAGNFGVFETEGNCPGGASLKEDDTPKKYYTICDKNLSCCDCRPLEKLLKEWIRQDRISVSTELVQLSVSL